ncbi:hypothetical protein ABIC44_000991 [Sphingomonas sp. 1185]
MKTLFIYLALAALLAIAWLMWAHYGLDVAAWGLSSTTGVTVEKAGQWSDSFGAFNALVSALGFGAVLATLWFQAVSLKDQAKDQYRQRFETTFFELLRIMRELRSEIRFEHSAEYAGAQSSSRLIRAYAVRGQMPHVNDKAVIYSGYEAIKEAVKEIRFWINTSENGEAKELNIIYNKKIHKLHEPTFSPYFRIIYTILFRLSKDKMLSQLEKAEFGNLLRSQLTSDEILLMATNGLSPVSKDFSNFIIEFRMLKYLTKNSLRTELERHYSPTAFQARD